MKVVIVGLGHVGLTTAGCLLRDGHTVLGIDRNERRVAEVAAGRCPIAEPDLEPLLQDGVRARRLSVADAIGPHLAGCDLVIVAVGTPGGEDGTHDLRQAITASEQLAEAIKAAKASRPPIVYRSTMLPGSMTAAIAPVFGSSGEVDLAYHPEFLREGSAVGDYFNPARIVIGTAGGPAPQALLDLYAGIAAPVFVTSFAEAETIKLADNAWHAVKVAFANELGRISAGLGVDPLRVHEMFVADTKLNISAQYLRPGGAFGGPCLPKDLRALAAQSAMLGTDTPLIAAAGVSNEAHKRFLLARCSAGLPQGARILLLGLSFKKGAGDLRGSPYAEFAKALIAAGYALSLHDPSIAATQVADHEPALAGLMIGREQVEAEAFDRVVDTGGYAASLSLRTEQVVDLQRLA